jgi:hypothetical protein
MANPNPTPFKKTGAAANPKGRPKREWTVAGLIEEAMEQEDETGVPYKKAVYNMLVSKAKAGDMVAVKEVNQRLDGMPKQDIGLGNAESGPLEIIVTEEKIPNYDKK